MRTDLRNGLTRASRAIRRVAILGAAAGMLIACGGLLDVDLPTRVPASTLDDPALAPVLVQGAIADFECAFTNYAAATGLLTDELIDATGWIAITSWDQRRILPDNGNLGTGSCTTLGYGVYTPLQTARFQAEDAYKRISAYTDEQVADRQTLLATAAAYAAYSYVLLGEAFCEMAIDQGPLMQPNDVLALAEERFTTAIQHAQSANDAAILNMALVGRARARLDLGDKAGAADDAKQVPDGFVLNATYSGVNERRFNRIAVDFHRNYFLSVDPSFRDLTVAGVPDTRVAIADADRRGHDGSTPVFTETKYVNDGDPMPLATWQEAQLIIAEAEGGQSAVDAINRVRAAADLPPYTSTDEAAIRAQVLEERRRTLFLDGHRLNDVLRLHLPWAEGTTHKGVAFGPTKCLPLPDVERLTNPNLGG